MKKLILVALALLLATPAMASNNASGGMSFGLTSKPLWRGVNPMQIKDNVPDNTAAIDLSGYSTVDGIYLSGRLLAGEGGFELDKGIQRANIQIGFASDALDWATVNFGTMIYTQNRDDELKLRQGEVYAGITINTLLNPSATVFYNYDQKSDQGDALFYQFNISHAMSLNDYFDFIVKGEMGINQGNHWFGDYEAKHHAEASVKVRYWHNPKWTVEPYATQVWALSEGAERAGVEDDTVFGLNLVYNY